MTAAIAVIAVAAAVIGGYALGARSAPAELATPPDTSADAGFARDMQTHHAQAVEMSMLAYRKATNPELAVIGYDVALTQQAQIGTMSDWLQQWNLSPTGSRPAMAWMSMTDPSGQPMAMQPRADGRMPGMATDDELARLRTLTGKQFDILYAQLMIRHHLGGITMIDGLLRQGERPEVKALAQSMKTGQQNEIKAFTDILTSLGAHP
jgi:uncharacterized protein (DUF305 family)